MDTSRSLVPVRQVYDVEVLEPEREVTPAEKLQSFAQMIANAVVAQQQAPALSELEKAELYETAFREWLASNPRTGKPRPANTIAAYRDAWEDFRTHCSKVLWKVEGLDVRAWVDDLRQRTITPSVAKGLIRNGRRTANQVGLSDATINQWLAAISAFYSFCEQYEVRLLDGRIVPLFEGINPGKSKMVKRPKNRPFEKSIYLAPEQLRALMQAMRAHQHRNPAKALRDYAMLMCYISTGGRNSEVRTWQWQDLEQRGALVFYNWSNKGKSGKDELPGDAWEAVKTYLQATGRWGSMKPEDYVFQPHSDAVTRLRRADGSAVVSAEDWSRNRPLSGQEVNRCLRQYAKAAGLDPDRIHVHVLRHSAYMLYRESGLSLEERSRLLHHSSLQITSIYDHSVAGQRNVGWAKASSLLGL